MADHNNPFTYYEIRCCVDNGEDTISFLGPTSHDPELGEICTPENALKEAREHAETVAGGATPFWTIYGYDRNGAATAIGDFKSFKAAFDTLGAILMPLRNAIMMMEHGWPQTAQSYLEDICNQSTNSRRL